MGDRLNRLAVPVGTLLGVDAAGASCRARWARDRGRRSAARSSPASTPAPSPTLVKGRRIASVTGTNGKTTTTHLLAAAIRQGLGSDAARLVTNADGANLHYGIASALAKAPKADIAVLETDERVVADLIAHGRPEVLVMLNFSRDQLDRNHEIKFLARSWRDALAAAGEAGPVVVANSDDPLVVWAARGASRTVWVDTASTWTADAALCPACGEHAARVDPNPGEPHRGAGTAPPATSPSTPPTTGPRGHGSPCPTAAWSTPGSTSRARSTSPTPPARWRPPSSWASPVDDALAGSRTVEVARRTVRRGALRRLPPARLVLSKNPAGWAESLPLLGSDPVILAIDSVAADGKDVSWLWDVDFEQLVGKHVVCTGPRAYDLAVRLEYGGIEHEVILDVADAVRSVRGTADPVDVIATYTPFQKLLKMAGLR